MCVFIAYKTRKWILREKEEILREGGDARQQQSKDHGSCGKKGNVGNTLRGCGDRVGVEVWEPSTVCTYM